LSPVSFGREKISSLSPGFLLSRANGFRGQAAVKPKLEVVTNIGRPTRTPLFLGAMLQPSRLALVAVVLALAACVRQGAPAPVVHSSSGVAASPAQGAVIGMPRAVQAPADGQIVVRSGESLYVVAQRAGVPVRALIDANDLRPPYAVSNGQRLTVPRQATHQVQAGDTLAGIARRYGFGTNELVRANAMTAPYAVQVGQVLTLPGAAGPVVAGVTPNPASSLATPPPSPVASAVTPPPAAIERAPRGAVESTILPPPSPVAAAPAAEPAPTPVAILPTPAPVLNPAAIQPASLPVPQTLAPPEPDN
jgi:LysM repeat protein